MAFRPFPLVGAAYADSSRPWSAQRSINLLLQPSEDEGTRSRAKLVGVPGLAAYCAGMQEAPVRGLYDCEGLRLAVAGDKLYQITPARVAIALGTVPGTGRVEMAHNKILNGYEVLVANGQSGYVYNTRTSDYGQITDSGFPGSGLRSPAFIDGYLAGVEGQGRFWAHSELRQAMEWNTLDRYDAEAQPDKIQLLRVRNRSVLVLGDASGQFFRNTGALTGTFQNENGMEFTVGAASRYAAEVVDSNVVWLGNDGLVYTLDGPSPVILSTGPIAEAMAEHDLSTCFTTLWEDGKHKVVYFTFPQGRTYGIDLWTRTWHERKSYGLDRWRVSALCKWGRDWIAGDYSNGRLYRLDWNVQAELGQPLVRRRVTGAIHASANPINVNALRIIADTGRSTVGPGEFPVQPVGPTISGDAPDGVVNAPYAGYTYSATPGDAPIVSWRLVSGELPPNVTFSNGTLSTGTPTQIKTYRFRIRVTDQNGLFADLEDQIDIRFSFAAWILKLNASMGIRSYIAVDQKSGRVAGVNYEYDEIIVSEDGFAFERIASVNPRQPTGLAWSPGLSLFFAPTDADNGTYNTSLNARTWSAVSSFVTDNKRGAAWSPHLRELVTVAAPNLVRSPNGTNFSGSAIGLANTEAIEWSNVLGGYVVAGARIHLTNSNGTSAALQPPNHGSYMAIAESDDIVAVVGVGSVATCRADGEWASHPAPITFTCIAWVPFAGRFIAGGRSGFSESVIGMYSSPDGIAWTLEAEVPSTASPFDMAVSELHEVIYMVCIKNGANQGELYLCGAP